MTSRAELNASMKRLDVLSLRDAARVLRRRRPKWDGRLTVTGVARLLDDLAGHIDAEAADLEREARHG